MSESFHPEFPQTQPVRRYEPVPQGVCEVEIIKAERKAVPWRATDANPTGECIALRLRASSTHAFLFADLPDDKPWVRQHVARAVGINADACVPEELIGRRAQVQIEHTQTRAGQTRAVVRKWLPLTDTCNPTPARPTLADALTAWERDDRKQTTPVTQGRPAPVLHPDDDIPF